MQWVCTSAEGWVRAGSDSARAAPTSGGVSECAVDVREGCGYVFLTSLHPRVSGCLGGEAYIQARLPTYKKVCVNLARERMILDLSAGYLIWLLAHPKLTRRVTLAAALLQACSSLAFTLALLLLLPAQARTHSYTTAPRHSSVPVCCMRWMPAHSQLLFALADHRGISNN